MSEHRIPRLRFGRAITGDLDQAERREWWLTNGLGGYAAGTLALTLTRRYHGLLIAPLAPPLGRQLVFAKADATVTDGDRHWSLFSNRWAGGVLAPQGHVSIESFTLIGRLPVWVYAIGDLRIEQRIWMRHGLNQTCVAWRILEPAPERTLALSVDILANHRDHHGVAHPGQFAPELHANGTGLRIEGPGTVASIAAIGGTLQSDPVWIEGFDLPIERERGLEDRDNHLRVATAKLSLSTNWVGLCLAAGDAPSTVDLDDAWNVAHARDGALIDRASAMLERGLPLPAWLRQSVLAADSFVFARPLEDVPNGESVIAGYPWFGDWGRDTMIALPGLTLATGQAERARLILATFARFVDGGMLPNVFPGAGETPEYNTVDAALWFIQAWARYLAATDDVASLESVYPTLLDIVTAYRDGTRFGIAMDPDDGLITAGADGVQLTWMDAKVGDWVVTPRRGKPVEINALWYNALVHMGRFAARLGHADDELARLADQARASFARFVRDDGAGLLDVLDGPNGDDGTLRPNQIFAVSLDHSPLGPAQQQAVVATCGQHLLTSLGLRSLSPDDPAFLAEYRGDVLARDGAYHQGPVWGWLLGHYVIALHRVTQDRAAALELLTPLGDHLYDAAIGQMSEIFDGAAPHMHRGAPAQAWTVACALEAWWRLTSDADPSQPTDHS